MNNLPNPRKPTHNKTLGIEIECVIDREVADKITTPYHGMFKVDTDGSIRAGYNKRGKELVSQPLPASWLKNEITKLYKKFKWSANESCGIHVHVSRKWWSVKKAEKLATYLAGLSRADMKLFFGREPNEFCQNIGVRPLNRYLAINFTPKNTIEIRAFSSGDAEWAKYCVAFTDLLVRHRGEYTYPELLRMKAEASGKPVVAPLVEDTRNNDRPYESLGELLRAHAGFAERIEQPQPDADGWIEWRFQSRTGPLTPDTLVQVRLRGGSHAGGASFPVSTWRWTNLDSGGDIVAYRPVPQPAQQAVRRIRRNPEVIDEIRFETNGDGLTIHRNGREERVPPAPPGEDWMLHLGQINPAPGGRVEVQFRRGNVSSIILQSDRWCWDVSGQNFSDIVRWRPTP